MRRWSCSSIDGSLDLLFLGSIPLLSGSSKQIASWVCSSILCRAAASAFGQEVTKHLRVVDALEQDDHGKTMSGEMANNKARDYKKEKRKKMNIYNCLIELDLSRLLQYRLNVTPAIKPPSAQHHLKHSSTTCFYCFRSSFSLHCQDITSSFEKEAHMPLW